MSWSKKPPAPPAIFRQCLKKKAYQQSFQAGAVAKKMTSKGKPVEAYKCPMCGHYHVGRKRKEKQ